MNILIISPLARVGKEFLGLFLEYGENCAEFDKSASLRQNPEKLDLVNYLRRGLEILSQIRKNRV